MQKILSGASFNCPFKGCENNCNGNGNCTVKKDENEWHCECHNGFEGDACEHELESQCGDDIDNDGGNGKRMHQKSFIG